MTAGMLLSLAATTTTVDLLPSIEIQIFIF